jgi:hypothetical protein
MFSALKQEAKVSKVDVSLSPERYYNFPTIGQIELTIYHAILM